ncbi:MAG: fimbrillin family protein [Muribaculaceae bacterium]|nr:fimbrillin family protein [Muribaculaceae bacterium]
MRTTVLRTLAMMSICAFTAGCSDDTVLNREPAIDSEGSGCIVFTVSQSDSRGRGGSPLGSRPAGSCYIFSGPDSLYMDVEESQISPARESRASYITGDDMNTLMMTCRRRTSATAYDYYFTDIPFTLSDGTWKSDPPYWWLSDNSHYTFYGYAPSDAPGVTFTADETDWQPKLRYALPTDAKQQADIVFNSSVPEYISSANQTVPLTMRHALANITFVTGDDMQRGRITAVRLKNVIGSGVLNLTTGDWTLDEATIDCTASVNVQSADNTDITTGETDTYFMLLPGSCTRDTQVEVDITMPSGANKTFSSPLSTVWEAGRQYKYTISIYPQVSIDLVPETQDAHYVITRVHVSAELGVGQSWHLTASASDGADVTILPADQINEFQADGFWVDKIIENGVATNARGTATAAGSGSTYLYIFLPENISDDNRVVTLSLKSGESGREYDVETFEQFHPAWTQSGHGWEQTHDSSAQFGFAWDYKVSYGYLYSAIGSNRTYRDYCQSIIDENNAASYASVETYRYSWLQIRYCITIDYSKLSSLNYVNSLDNGLGNTREMNQLAGIAVTNAFETVIQNIKKTESGHQSENAFRKGNGASGEAPAPSGTEITSSPAIGECLKKNRYTLLKTTTTVDGQVNTAYIPQIAQEDIVWYLPAVNQFASRPSDVRDAIVPGECWSSNTQASSNTNAYLGDGSVAGRLTEHKIRACRDR